MGSNLRQALTTVSLYGVQIDLPKLALFLKRLPELMKSLSLGDIRLLSGTWCEALEVLQKKETLDDKRVYVPQGAECESMASEDFNRIFGRSFDKRVTETERYIANLQPERPNPLDTL